MQSNTTLVRHFFGLCRQIEQSTGLSDFTQTYLGGRSIKTLDNSELQDACKDLNNRLAQIEAPNCNPASWLKIRFLQCKSGWSDDHLLCFITHVLGLKHWRFIDTVSARKLITAMELTSAATVTRLVPSRGAARKSRPSTNKRPQ